MNTDKNDFKFDGKISLNVLNNYLSRAITYGVYSDWDCGAGRLDPQAAISAEAIINVGAKYVSRFIASWIPAAKEEMAYPAIAELITKLHGMDPDIVFEACIFETVTKHVGTIKIPAYVFEAFGRPVEDRCFSCEASMFDEGTEAHDKFLNRWGDGNHVPDITKEETQMFFYYRACEYIKMGIEAIHLGQVNLIGWADTDNACWTKVVGMIRDFAAENARRHYVIIDGHHPKQVVEGNDGVMLVDFNAFPLRIEAADNEVDHEVAEDYPQMCDIKPLTYDAVYLRHIHGVSPSGWETDDYPYLVEFDNWGGKTGDNSKKAARFGYDEIAWYTNQPAWYRHRFLNYIVTRVDSFLDNGHVAMPGRRTSYILKEGKQHFYCMNNKDTCPYGFEDEDTIRKILLKLP